MAKANHVTIANCAPITGASTQPSTGSVRAAHAELIAGLVRYLPRSIPVDARAIDLEDRADHLNTVLNALSVYLTAIFDDTAENVAGGLDLCQINALLSDLRSEVAGTLGHGAAGLAGRLA